MISDQPRRLVLTSPQASVNRHRFDVLAGLGVVIDARPDLAFGSSRATLASQLVGAWGIVAGTERYDAKLLAKLPKLRVIARMGSGLDSVDIVAANRRDVVVMSAPGMNAQTVADHTLALILGITRRIPWLDRQTKAGAWRPLPPLVELSDLTVGIVGLGAIGRSVVERLGAFGCQMIGADVEPDLQFCENWSVRVSSLDDLVSEADVVTIHVPSSPSTDRLFDTTRLARMKPGSILVNTSRGGVVDEAGLLEALESGRISAAALDVFEIEPMVDSALQARDDIILTPHTAGISEGASRRMADLLAEKLMTYIQQDLAEQRRA